jgi:zinc transport system substrate-binding protein
MEKSRAWTFVVIAFVIVGSAILAANRASLHKGKSDAIQVTATFYPLAEFARQVGGDRVQVTTLIKPGVEPHDYDPTPRDVAGIYKSAMFVYNGAGLEPWVGKVQKDLRAGNVMMVDASSQIELRQQDPAEHEAESATDPHIWMDPQLAMKEVDNVRKGLVAVDPKHAYDYIARAEAYTKKLQDLDKAFQSGLANCQSKDIVTSHQAFSYLAARYGLNAVGIAGLSPEDEPTPQKLAEVADFARAHNITHIFFETAVSPKLSETIAHEVGAKTISFDPLESLTSGQIKAGKNYISIQKDNLKSLQTALRCTP